MNIKKWLFFKSNRVYLLTLKYNCRLLFRIYYQHVNVFLPVFTVYFCRCSGSPAYRCPRMVSPLVVFLPPFFSP